MKINGKETTLEQYDRIIGYLDEIILEVKNAHSRPEARGKDSGISKGGVGGVSALSGSGEVGVVSDPRI